MCVKDFKIRLCSIQDVREFIEYWHYSKSVNGIKHDYCFSLNNDDTMIGAMVYGQLAMEVQSKYVKNKEDLIELRRLCCIDDTPKNTESFFIGKTMRWLKQNTNIKVVISYADPNFGHSGVIYKATNFTLVGKTSPGRVIIFNGRRYHDKCIRTKYNGKPKPFAQRIIEALKTGDAYYVNTLPKNIYTYRIR